FAATILAMEKTVGLPKIVLADTGFASGPAVEELQRRGERRYRLRLTRRKGSRFAAACGALAARRLRGCRLAGAR
ncbi:MAG: hypothetical protein M0Z28_01310, partial [Rhodospirillales bacterium]|nr:hypothetical protein [Rhodospirillales bacterium]